MEISSSHGVFDDAFVGIAAVKVLCSLGEATVGGVSPGQRFLQLDGIDVDNNLFFRPTVNSNKISTRQTP